MGRYKSLDSLKSFLSYASQPSGASILGFHILTFLGADHRSQITGILLLPECPWGSLARIGGLQCADDCDILVYEQGRKDSISQRLLEEICLWDVTFTWESEGTGECHCSACTEGPRGRRESLESQTCSCLTGFSECVGLVFASFLGRLLGNKSM